MSKFRGGIAHDFFKQSLFVKFGKTDPLAETLHTLDTGGTERIQALRAGESVEQKEVALIVKYGSGRGVLFIRIKGRDA